MDAKTNGALAVDPNPATWQRSIELRPGHWSEWSEYHDLYGEGRPERVGRFNCRYRPLYAVLTPESAP